MDWMLWILVGLVAYLSLRVRALEQRLEQREDAPRLPPAPAVRRIRRG
jgi:hypothetical protein